VKSKCIFPFHIYVELTRKHFEILKSTVLPTFFLFYPFLLIVSIDLKIFFHN